MGREQELRAAGQALPPYMLRGVTCSAKPTSGYPLHGIAAFPLILAWLLHLLLGFCAPSIVIVMLTGPLTGPRILEMLAAPGEIVYLPDGGVEVMKAAV